ncbi:MAG: pyruvate dehydrogenase complex dihydrolipoamide acetyltransferase [Bacteroidota bacterium]
MAEIIRMPRLSDTMTEGVIAAWHKQVGEDVSSGDLLAEIETDKATMDLESFFDGKLLHIGVEEGKGIPVGELLAIIGEEGEDISPHLSAGAAAEPSANGQESAEEPVEAPAAEVPVAEPVVVSGDGRIKASPLAKAMAKEKGIDLSQVAGSGDQGRIVKRDIENFKGVPTAVPTQPAAVPTPAQAPAPTPSPAPLPVASVPAVGEAEEVRVSQMRKTIAKRLSESKFSAPHFYLTMEINMDKTMAARKALNEASPVKISFNDIIIKAAAVALKQHPAINSSWLGETIRYNKEINIGMAVAIDEGLLVPVIRHANAKGLINIAEETKALAGRARNRELQPSEWQGNTFTISNLGMFGIEEFTAIINPPDACILAVGGIIPKAIIKEGEIVPGNMMKVTLSCDHRVVDGASGSAFLKTLKELLEDPLRILL